MQNSMPKAVILTFNEENNIANTVTNASRYLQSIYVLDSLSTDNTVLAAKGDFDWIFFLDADEELNEELGRNLK